MSHLEKERFTDAEIAYITTLKEESSLDWAELTEKYNNKFKKDRSLDSVKKGYQRNRARMDDNNEYVRTLKAVATTRKANSLNSKDLKKVLTAWEEREDILDAISAAAKKVSKHKVSVVKKSKNKNKKNMTLELLVSDIHVGKMTDTFNNEVSKRRLKQVADTAIKEMQRAAEHYTIDRFIIAFLGDMIESATMHGVESSKSCEFGNSRQVQECLEQCYELIVLPIAIEAAKFGARVDCIGVAGNHDRTEHDRTMTKPGEDNLTWIIYNAIRKFGEQAGLKNVSWNIPVESYATSEIYGEGILWEHYDNAKGPTRQALEGLLAKRTNQLKKPIRFMRGGHFHAPAEFGIGEIIINGNSPGNDGYSTTLGFDCEPSQTLNFYIEREKSDSIKRQSSFYKRFLIQLA